MEALFALQFKFLDEFGHNRCASKLWLCEGFLIGNWFIYIWGSVCVLSLQNALKYLYSTNKEVYVIICPLHLVCGSSSRLNTGSMNFVKNWMNDSVLTWSKTRGLHTPSRCMLEHTRSLFFLLHCFCDSLILGIFKQSGSLQIFPFLIMC